MNRLSSLLAVWMREMRNAFEILMWEPERKIFGESYSSLGQCIMSKWVVVMYHTVGKI
jgi:hypothetical protein